MTAYVLFVMFSLVIAYQIMWRKLRNYYMDNHLGLFVKHILNYRHYNRLLANWIYVKGVMDENFAMLIYEKNKHKNDRDPFWHVRISVLLR